MPRERAHSQNRLIKHAAFPKIMSAYNAKLRADGQVNAKQFFLDFIEPEIPSMKLASWYYFLKKFATKDGLNPETSVIPSGQGAAAAITEETKVIMLDNQKATASLLQKVLNISEQAAQEVLENPTLVPYEKRIELGLKVMKAQDSRVKAIGAIKADNREQARFDKMMDSAAYS